MGHFAKLDANNKVIGVHTLNNEVFTVDGKESEQVAIDFLTALHNHSLWKQTSYNGRTRYNYAGVGYTYNADADAFIAPDPECHPERILNTDNYQWNCDNADHNPQI